MPSDLVGPPRDGEINLSGEILLSGEFCLSGDFKLPGELLRSDNRCDHHIVPVARDESSFGRYYRRVIVPAILLNIGLNILGWTALFACLGLIGGLAGGVFGIGFLVGVFAVGVNRFSLLGNQSLLSDLRSRLGSRGHFVGLRRPGPKQSYGLETDDNVGLLMLDEGEGALVLKTEERTLRFLPDQVRSVSLIRQGHNPYGRWIAIELTNAHADRFYVVSRQARTLAEERKNTEELYERLIEWHYDGLIESSDDFSKLLPPDVDTPSNK